MPPFGPFLMPPIPFVLLQIHARQFRPLLPNSIVLINIVPSRFAQVPTLPPHPPSIVPPKPEFFGIVVTAHGDQEPAAPINTSATRPTQPNSTAKGGDHDSGDLGRDDSSSPSINSTIGGVPFGKQKSKQSDPSLSSPWLNLDTSKGREAKVGIGNYCLVSVPSVHSKLLSGLRAISKQFKLLAAVPILAKQSKDIGVNCSLSVAAVTPIRRGQVKRKSTTAKRQTKSSGTKATNQRQTRQQPHSSQSSSTATASYKHNNRKNSSNKSKRTVNNKQQTKQASKQHATSKSKAKQSKASSKQQATTKQASKQQANAKQQATSTQASTSKQQAKQASKPSKQQAKQQASNKPNNKQATSTQQASNKPS
ncbi:hypothetical protein niasHS_009848 [Heterodera schachtii]|uniref:Uncharacterized protein n=1 Tax=Heterodera schachtii TaxID=97005 RepID=A0ABD2JAJ4_HETSC